MNDMEVLVIKYYERLVLNGPVAPDVWPQWMKVTVGTLKENYTKVTRYKTKQITREEAKQIIQENGLVEVYESKDGKVFDTPDRAFQKKYKGTLPIPVLV